MDGPRCELCGLFEFARAHDQAGEADSAIKYYERLVNTPTLLQLYEVWSSLPFACRRLGELYQAKGDRQKAVQYYSAFVDLWKEADPDLQPQVRDVKRRLANLAGEPRAR